MSEKLYVQRLLKKIFRRQFSSSYFSTSKTEGVFSKPFITIAREPGSGGGPIGEVVAKRLGFEFYDQEILDVVSKSTKLRKEVLEKIDERGRSAVQDFMQSVLNPNYVSDVTFAKHLSKVVATLAYKGNVVILGRGARFLTPRDRGLHVRITAPLSTRIARAVEYEKVSEQEARQIIKDVSKDRRDFVRQYFGKDINRSEYYDLVINTEFFDFEESVELILAALERKFN
jgi:cytidylate kinase